MLQELQTPNGEDLVGKPDKGQRAAFLGQPIENRVHGGNDVLALRSGQDLGRRPGNNGNRPPGTNGVHGQDHRAGDLLGLQQVIDQRRQHPAARGATANAFIGAMGDEIRW